MTSSDRSSRRPLQPLPPADPNPETRRDAQQPKPVSRTRPKQRPAPGNRRRDRFGVLNEFVDKRAQYLKPVDVAVWLVLFRDTRKDGSARVAQSYIAQRLGIARRTVVRVVQRLEKQGLVSVVHRGGRHRGISIYRLQFGP